MLAEIIVAIIAGIIAGIFTGLTPGIHINLVSLLVVSVSGYFLGFLEATTLCVFIISMGVVHTFLDAIPSVFLGAPDAEQALNALPGHVLLLKGMGYEAVKLTIIGSLLCLMLTIAIIPFLIPFVPSIYSSVEPYIGWLLLAVVLFMILKNKGWGAKFWSTIIFLSSGLLGIIVFSTPNVQQPLFPMLSGMFGISTLLTSLFNKVNLPEQKISETIEVKPGDMVKALGAGTFSGCLIGLFPGLGAAQAAVLASQLTGNIGMYGFMILVGGINTVNFVFSLVTLYLLNKARNGAIVAVMEIMKSINLNDLILFLSAALIAGGIATFMAMGITRIFAKIMNKVNYSKLCWSVIIFIILMVCIFSGWLGLFVLIVSTAIGIVPVIKNVGRSNAMGCLLLPVILYFLL